MCACRFATGFSLDGCRAIKSNLNHIIMEKQTERFKTKELNESLLAKSWRLDEFVFDGDSIRVKIGNCFSAKVRDNTGCY